MVNLRILQSYRVLRSIFFFALAVISFQQFLAPVAQAYGEQYSWVDSMTIRATGGRYGSQTFDFKAGTRYNPGRDNIPQFDIVDQVNDTGDGCVLHPILTFSGKNAGRATFSADPESPLDCPSETVAKYDARINLLHTENQSTTHASNRTIKVTSRITKSNPYPNNSDTITLKETRSGDVVGTKHVGSSDAYSDVDWLGYKTSFNNLSNDLAYTACSKSLGVCQSGIRNPNTGTPADDIADEITITKIIEGGSDGGDTTSCAVEGVGWMICPVVTFLGKITDQMYDLLADNLLKVQAGEIFDTSGGTYKAWSTIRNIANVAFVLAFLFVIYSQITGAGLSNYGIKKMLPKIVIAAILVNVSFWVCAVAVDISNILGYSLKEFFDPSNSNFSYTITADGVTKTGNGWTGLAVAVVATAALVYIGLSVLLPALVVVALAVLTVVTVLAVRQALIILLIVVSPLAFVAYLLPNTEEWFKKWLSLFKTMLLVFPIISVVFGASALASKVVMDAAQGNVFVSIVGALISIVPLFITPIIMKSAGGVLNRIGGVINNPNKGPFDRMRKGAEGYRKNRQEYRNLKSMNGYRSLPGRGTFSRMGSRRKAVLDNRKSELNRANASYVADLAENNSGFRKSLARGGGDGSDMRALAGAINVQTKLSIDEVNAASAVIENLNLPSNQLNDLAKGHDVAGLEGSNEATRRAAIKSALKKATVADAEDIIKSSGTMTDAQRQDVVDGLVSNGITSKATHLGGKTLEDIAQGNVTSEADLDEAVAYHFNKGKYSAEALVSQDGASAERVHRVAAAGTTSKGTVIDSTQKATVKVEAAKVKTDPRLNTRISSDQARTALSGLETM